MDILMIGGSGIISSEICNLAIEHGDSVSIFNRGRRKEEINSKANLIIGDMRNESVQSITDKIMSSYDVVMDFISYTPEQLRKTIDIFSSRCKQFVFVSSATVYSSDAPLPFKEDSKLENTKWKYAQDKVDCENFLASSELSCEYTIIRPYVTYGRTRIPLQIAPLEYYTIINRIKCHKPIIISGEHVECTLTNSKDFAIGAYGLLLNEKAYGEAFHITGDYRTTWKEVVLCLAEKINEDVEFINIPMQYLQVHKKYCGFDVSEILGDKGRNMIFDNSKIKRVVPAFSNFRRLEEALDDSLKYFEKKSHQRVNYKWDAEVDCFIANYIKRKGIIIDPIMLSELSYGETINDKDKKMYLEYRFPVNRMIGKVKRKICRG
ncbi:Nucleoside-diphosphate-sugar epimerase [Lachnospiraceae bacterium NLAE-zl-G231]|nr:Nucleoside-diphosphate-sugar epimerase [Lachnospiraceae bacterium NLAE-zl-G231]